MEETTIPLKQQVERYLDGKRKSGRPPKYPQKHPRKSKRAAMQAKLEIAAVARGEKPNKSAIGRSLGYAESSISFQRPQATHSYQRTIKDYLDQLDAIRRQVADAMERKDYEGISASDLAQVLKVLNHDIQMLSGGKTENIGIEEDRQVIHTILQDMRKPNDGTRVPELPPAPEAI